MKQKLTPGGTIEAMTADEFAKLIPREMQVTRMRVSSTIALNASGNGTDAEIYKCPVGYEFEARRIVLTLTGTVPNDPNTGNVLLNAAGKFVAYMRSNQLIEYGQPQYGAAIQVPGVQTWGDQQGPLISNGEYFGITAQGLTANTQLSVYLEGLLKRPSTDGPARAALTTTIGN